MEKIVPFWPIDCEERAEASFVPYLKYLNFKICNMDSGFECMNVFYCCVYNEIQYLYISAIQYNNIKNKIKSSDQLL